MTQALDQRPRAEALLASPSAVAVSTPCYARTMVHELQVHQTELEARNAELQHAQEELILARDRYIELFQAVPVGCLTLDSLHRIQDANLAAKAMFGNSGKDLVGYRLDTFVAAKHADAFYVFLRQAAKASTPQRRDFRFRRSSTSLFWADLQVIPARSPGSRGLFRITLNDITERKSAEEERARLADEVQAERERLSALVASIQDEVWFTDTQQRFTLANPAALREFGRRTYPGIPVADLVASVALFAPDGHPRSVEDAPPLRALKGEVILNQEELLRSPRTGRMQYRQVSASPVKDAAGDIIGAVTVVHDITQMKATEDQLGLCTASLRASERQMQQALLVGRSFTFEWQPETDQVIRSASSGEILGLAEGEACNSKGAAFFRSIHPDDQETVSRTLQGLSAFDNTYTVEFRVVREDGSTIVLQESGQATFDDGGKLQRLSGVSTDVTAHRRTEAALRASEELNSRTLNSLPAQVAVLDRQGRIIVVNKSWEEFGRGNGAKGDDAVGVGANYLEVCRRAMDGNDPDAARALTGIEAVLSGASERFSMEYPCNSQQEARWFVMNVYRLGSAEEGGAVITHLDITERQMAEAQVKKSLAEKVVLLKEVHHRVKNNLQVISSLVHLQTENQTDPAVMTLLDDVRNRVGAMALVHEKLYESPDLGSIDFAEYAENLLRTLWLAHGRPTASVSLALDLEPVVLPASKVVPLGLILTELASNALKHAFQDRDGGEVRVKLRTDDKERVALQVRDNGAGLPAGFDWRRSGSLGLRLVKILSRQLEARIDLHPVDGGGTEYEIAFDR